MPFKGDSFIIDILNPTDTHPLIIVKDRHKNRTWGKVAGKTEFKSIPIPKNFNGSKYKEVATKIGKLILDNSDIIEEWRS